jgi:hypothetical protein
MGRYVRKSLCRSHLRIKEAVKKGLVQAVAAQGNTRSNPSGQQ